MIIPQGYPLWLSAVSIELDEEERTAELVAVWGRVIAWDAWPLTPIVTHQDGPHASRWDGAGLLPKLHESAEQARQAAEQDRAELEGQEAAQVADHG